jgi:hypothetical protein
MVGAKLMKHAVWIVMFAVVGLLSACSGNPSPATPAAAAPSQQATADPNNPGTPAAETMPVPPEGAKYTLLCMSFTSPTHIADAARAKEYLIAHTELKDFYVVHSEQQSDLYYGFYKTYSDRSQIDEFTRAQTDLTKLGSLLNDQGDRVFPAVMFVPLSIPDPVAPKEWEVSHNPGYWTLQIAIYRDSPERKQAAVDAVRDARARGIEAYFYHGKLNSGVFIGSWPKEAATITDSFAATADRKQPVLVLSGPIAGMDNPDIYTPDGQKMQVDTPKLEVFDPTLQKAISDYPYTYINGAEMGRTNSRSGTVIPYPSFLVRVPHDGDVEPGSEPNQPTPDQNAPALTPDNPNFVPPDSPPEGLR